MPTQTDNMREFDKLDETGDIICPFCGEEDFDRIGLKQHLAQWCEPFKEL